MFASYSGEPLIMLLKWLGVCLQDTPRFSCQDCPSNATYGIESPYLLNRTSGFRMLISSADYDSDSGTLCLMLLKLPLSACIKLKFKIELSMGLAWGSSLCENSSWG